MIRSEDNSAISHDKSLTPVRQAVAMMIPSSEMVGPDGASQGAANLDGYLHALRRTWLWCLLAGGVLAAVTVVAVWQLVPNKYTAVAELKAYTLQPRMLNSGISQPQEKYETFISNIQQMLQARTTLTAALRVPAVKDHPLVKRETDQEGWIAEHLRVTNPKNSEILRVSVTVPDPKLAAELTNAVVNAYKEGIVEEERKGKNDKLNRLEGYLREQKNLESEQRKNLGLLTALVGSADMETLSIQQQIRLAQAQQVKTERAKTRVQRMRAKADLDVLVAREADFENISVQPDEVDLLVANDPIGRMLQDEIAALELGAEHAGTLSKPANTGGTLANATLGRGRQMIQDLSDRLDRIRDTMTSKWKTEQRKELRSAIAEKTAEYQSLLVLEKCLETDEEVYDKDFKDLGSKSYQVDMQNEEIRRLNGVVDNLSREVEFAKIEMESSPRIEILGLAPVPITANQPNNLILAAMAGLLVFVLPGIGMVLLDVRCQRVNTVNEVQDRLGLPVFGSVPMLPPRVTRGLDGPSKRGRRWQAVLSEAVSGIRANLLRLSDVRVVMVTSSVGGEGKTTVATQLAMSLARIGKHTALVDFDLPRPAVNNVFDLPLEPGICDVLRSDCSLADTAHEVSLPNLTVITSGIADAASSQYMNSARLAEVLEELRDRFDYVIVDGSPLIPVADARVVSRYVDGAICCVLRDVSRLKLIRQAADILTTFNVRLLGTVVTAKQDTYYLSPNGDREERLHSTVV
ncbi:MAG: exopolysaccharide transport family protein [Pirellulaceae bacterium]